MYDQDSYHIIYLELLGHTSKSKAPNFTNKLVDSLIKVYLKEEENISHIFPEIVEEKGNILFKFRRKNHRDHDHTINLEDLDETGLDKIRYEDDYSLEKNKVLTNYFLTALSLMTSMASRKSALYYYLIIKYYKFNLLEKIIK